MATLQHLPDGRGGRRAHPRRVPRRPPGPRDLPLIGVVRAIDRDPLGLAAQWVRTYGDTSRSGCSACRCSSSAILTSSSPCWSRITGSSTSPATIRDWRPFWAIRGQCSWSRCASIRPRGRSGEKPSSPARSAATRSPRARRSGSASGSFTGTRGSSPNPSDSRSGFRPGRWESGRLDRLPRFAYFPFGGGPRHCIGQSFATMEGLLLLAAIARRFELVREPNPPVGLWPVMTLRPKEPIRITVRARRLPG